MPFLVQAIIDDHTLAVTKKTAKEAFAKRSNGTSPDGPGGYEHHRGRRAGAKGK
jgi:hypothetical protein